MRNKLKVVLLFIACVIGIVNGGRAAAFDGIKVSPATSDVQLGDQVLVGAFGSVGNDIQAQFIADSESFIKNATLYIDGVPMTGIHPVVLGPEAFGAGKEMPIVTLSFILDRDPNDNDNRAAWDTLLWQLGIGKQNVQVGVSYKNQIPHMAAKSELKFRTRPTYVVVSVIAIGFVLFLLIMIWAVYSDMLREDGKNSAYSLGKTQMAFWGALVALCFLGVWVISENMERIPPGVLILLGISGSTGLGSILISLSKRNSAVGELQEAKEKSTTLEKELASQTAAPESPIKTATIKSLEMKIVEQKKEIANKVKQAAPAETTKKWLTDILTDPNEQLSFSRVQVVLWTLILGIVFVFTVANTFSMPEFSTTLLTLMGISNGTYIGFKIPEKATVPPNPAPAPPPAA